jgi:hypothetical protein
VMLQRFERGAAESSLLKVGRARWNDGRTSGAEDFEREQVRLAGRGCHRVRAKEAEDTKTGERSRGRECRRD